MKTYHVVEAHKTEVVFTGTRVQVKRFIKNHIKYGTDPMFWDVMKAGNPITREWGGDFIETGFKFK